MKLIFRVAVCAFALVLLCSSVMAHMSTDVCDYPGELRRHYGCVAVRHTKADACCWMKSDGTHGQLPYTCCGTGWKKEQCEALIDGICNTHPDDM